MAHGTGMLLHTELLRLQWMEIEGLRSLCRAGQSWAEPGSLVSLTAQDLCFRLGIGLWTPNHNPKTFGAPLRASEHD